MYSGWNGLDAAAAACIYLAPAPVALPIWVIGSDGGFLPAPVAIDSLPMFTAERYDFILDFTGLSVGTHLYLTNEGGGNDPATTGQVMRFDVVPLTSQDTTVPPSQLDLPSFTPVGPASSTRKLSLNMVMSSDQPTVISAFELGLVNADGTPDPMPWAAPLTEHPALNSTEVWELHNFADGAHSIHLHLVEFQVVNREPLGGGATTPPSPFETGAKDTVMAPPGQITRIRSTFDRRSLYVWHRRFLEHEDHDMMRPYQVG